MIFVDTNVLIDLAYGRPPWGARSRVAVAQACAEGPVVINHIVLAELSPMFDALETLRGFVATVGIRIAELSDAAAFRAGRAHAAYRQAGGAREAILADFLIGGHASALGATLLTRDRRRFAGYFPELNIVVSEADHE